MGAELLAGGEGFLGVWGAGKRHGVGRCVLPDGSVFEGEIEAGGAVLCMCVMAVVGSQHGLRRRISNKRVGVDVGGHRGG